MGGGIGCGSGRVDAAGLDVNLEGPPPGPPGRSNLPFVIGLPTFGLPFGVRFEIELGDSPGAVWTVPLL